MAGLAIGSYALGRRADRLERPLRCYAWLEILIGCYGLASLPLLSGVHSAYVALAARLPYDSLGLVSFHFAACFLALVTPTALMGGTLPVALKGLVRRLEGVEREVGRLYGANTFGAALGVVLAGFFLLPVLGLRATVQLAALINLAIGLLVMRLDARMTAASPTAMHRGETEKADTSPLAPALLVTLVSSFALSGFSGLALEVVWTRALALYVGSSVYTFSAVLLAVLIGIAFGSVVVAWMAPRRDITLNWLAGALFGAGASTLALALFYNPLALVFGHLVMRYSTTYPLLLALEVLAIAACLLPPTLFSGATFPILSRIYVRRQEALSLAIGYLYAMNTVGCILGAFLSGFLLIPHIGLRATVMLCASLYVIAAAAVLLNGRGLARVVGGLSLPALATALLLLPPWRATLMSAGVFHWSFYDSKDAKAVLKHIEKGVKVIFYRDGAVATVAVVRIEGGRTLAVNAKADASDNVGDMDTQLLLGHLPLLLAPRTDSVLVVGLGSGTTCGAAALYPVRRIDCVEIEPAVVEAARYFRHVNRNVLQDPRFHLVLADARNYLAAGRKAYDVIISEPSNPWVAGVASLFTVEHFQAMRDHLSDDGIICQWLQLYEMSPKDVASVIATFTEVFPEATMWWVSRNHGDVALVAKKRPWRVALSRLRQRAQQNPEIAADLARAQFNSPVDLLSYLVLGPADLRRLRVAGQLNTDDWPYLEFSAPRSLYRCPKRIDNQILVLLASYKSQDLDHIVDLGDAARDPAAREALGDSFLLYHPPSEQLLFYLAWARDQFSAAATLAPQRAVLREKLALIETRIRKIPPPGRRQPTTGKINPSRASVKDLGGGKPVPPSGIPLRGASSEAGK
jgi:spermidine synthase